MTSNFNQTKENQVSNTLFFESNQSPIISLINKIFLENSGIIIESVCEYKKDNVLESVNAKFVNTNKSFILEIIHQEDFLVNVCLNDEDTLTEEELSIMKKLMNQLNDFGFCFYLDNEKETLDFDALLYDKKPIKVKSTPKPNDIWNSISKRMKELNMDTKTMNRIRVQRWHLMNKYGDDYVNYIGEYAEQQFAEYIKSHNIQHPKVQVNSTEIWANINQKMKDLNLPDKIKNRIRVQKTYMQKKYGENYGSYIEEYANNQMKDYLKD